MIQLHLWSIGHIPSGIKNVAQDMGASPHVAAAAEISFKLEVLVHMSNLKTAARSV